jgi:hypothetical protein
MKESFDGKDRLSKAKAILAAVGMVAVAEAAIPPNAAKAETVLQYTHDERLGQDPRIATLPKDTTVFQAVGKGQVNLVDGATLDPKITHIYQTTRGGTNIVKNKNLMRPDIVIIQEGGASVVMGGNDSNNVTVGGHANVIITNNGNVVSGENPGPPAPEIKMPDQWPFNDKGNPFKDKNWPFRN